MLIPFRSGISLVAPFANSGLALLLPAMRSWIRALLIIVGLFFGWAALSVATYDYVPDSHLVGLQG